MPKPTNDKRVSPDYRAISQFENHTGVVDIEDEARRVIPPGLKLYKPAPLQKAQLILVPKLDPSEPQHEIEVSEYGNLDGEPVVLIHGGPTIKINPKHLTFLDPDKMRIILISQRGSKGCKPEGEVVGNTTAHLVQDHAFIRKYLEIERWHVFGHSLGGTIACNYAVLDLEHVISLTCASTFLACSEAVDLLLAGEYEKAPEKVRIREEFFGASRGRVLMQNAATQILSPDEAISRKAAQAYLGLADAEKLDAYMTYIKIMTHYRSNNYFLDDNWLERIAPQLKEIPELHIAHSFQDEILPMDFSFKLYALLSPSADFTPLCGRHFFREEDAQLSLRAFCDRIYA